MTGNPFTYLQDSIDGEPPVLMVGDKKVLLTASQLIQMLKVIIDFVWQRGLRDG